MSINKASQKAPNLRFKGFTDDWEQRKLGELSNIVGGGTPSTSNPEYWDGDIHWYAPAEIGEQSYVNKSKKTITELGLKKSSARILPVGTVLFTSRAGIGNTAILAKEATTNQGFQSIVPDQNKLDSYFIFSRTNELKRYGEVTGAGSTFVEVSGKQMSKMPIMVPELSEQQKVGTLLKSLDDIITLHQRKLDQLNQLKEALLQQMFPGKGETAPKLRFAGFEGDWEERKFDEFLEEFIRKSKIENEFTTLSSTNSGMEVREGRVSGDTNIGYKIIENDDLVLSPQNLWLGNINLNYIGTGLVSPSYKTFKIKNLSSSFLKPQLRSKRLLNQYELASTQGASVVRRNLDMELFYQITLPVPVIQEQYKIGKLFKDLDDYIVLQSQKVNKLKSMKQVLLQNMFI
ncbi:restriction endonuclease subunit S [Enterococcus thailandicus]|uniref:restriction endonuclease subunit S n=1 Tax=Enterococcus thailandicus TaxID=417368 RepID=UPI00288CECF2|nr:restriction endonuclease subunit S [Enterococcus thailandicus]MDT2752971.1 restriction endonuclease subunit S [Enterococcus thailandicus]